MKLADIAIVVLIALVAGFIAYVYRDKQAQMSDAAARLAYNELSVKDQQALAQISERANSYLKKLQDGVIKQNTGGLSPSNQDNLS